PPSFYTDDFAAFASSRAARLILASYKPADVMECADYSLAMPGPARRELRIPHPVAFAELVTVAAKAFSRLLRKAHVSPISRSRPSYSVSANRAIQPSLRPSNLPRERAISRGGGAFLAKADVSHFYPSLYTHAVGWAIDPKLREKAHWKNFALLGKK